MGPLLCGAIAKSSYGCKSRSPFCLELLQNLRMDVNRSLLFGAIAKSLDKSRFPLCGAIAKKSCMDEAGPTFLFGATKIFRMDAKRSPFLFGAIAKNLRMDARAGPF
ncbi:hypothetical protein AVEN_146431-1 [Araneus ventricosus]|uniref:Uncharacterized protein n=1 Tax=Araneus ventricosus TaxID=182803 RepID=A0A4Y2NGY2_ARAVE|nr:hypothetical protein AVEN_146431-1 [Araneus ventricosus]